MFQEKIEKERFNGNKGRDEFIDQVMNITDPISKVDIYEISKLLERR